MAGYGVKVGDTVSVPGDMHGTVKFVGSVANKNGVFAGVQLAMEYATRGKNSGDVEGRYYFKTTIPGAGIFLPVEKAVKRPLPLTGSNGGGIRPSSGLPGTPNRLTSFNVGGRTPGTGKPNFSQSVSAAGRASPALKPPIRRESLPRPQSPLRKAQTPGKTMVTPKSRPGTSNLAKSQIGGPTGYRSAGPKPSLGGNKFSQSLRAASTASNMSTSSDIRSLGPESSFDEVPEEDGENTPTPTPNVVAAKKQIDPTLNRQHKEEMTRLQALLEEKDRALRDQNSSIAEMERNLDELSNLVPELSEQQFDSSRSRSRSRLRQDIEDEDLPRDVAALRATLREKNEKIKILTAEFDNNRADFRSTIDTLEMASTETERVYEKRVDELLEEVRNLQDRSEDVDSVAQQLKQLEELVQELEEGLEDARRGEAEARGEVEFLRGEVERSRSELRRERDRKRTEEQLNGYGGSDSGGEGVEIERVEELQSRLDSKDDEIRGLKTIIRNLQDADEAQQTTTGNSSKINGLPGTKRSPRTPIDNQNDSFDNNNMQQHIHELEALLQQKTAHEQELEKENSQLRNSVQLNRFPIGGNSAFGLRTGPSSSRPTSRDQYQMPGQPGSPSRTHGDIDKHISTGTTGSQRTVVLSPSTEKASWHQTSQTNPSNVNDPDSDPANETALPSTTSSPSRHRQKQPHQRNQSNNTDIYTASETSSSSTAALWCEICEEGGHDILSCKNMLGSTVSADATPTPTHGFHKQPQHERNKQSESMPKPLSMSRRPNARERMELGEPAGAPPDHALPPPPLSAGYAHPPSLASPPNAWGSEEADDTSRTETPAFVTPPPDNPHSTGGNNTASFPFNNTTSPSQQPEKGTINSINNPQKPQAPQEGTGPQAGMYAGKSSGVIDPERWCALCERDGHESVDCPFEDAF